ncbi:13343_t:CDS:1, partial [Racocetra persica]
SVKHIKNKISEIAEYIALLLNIWSTHPFLGITCHWLTYDFNLIEVVLDITKFLEAYVKSEIFEKLHLQLSKFGLTHKNIASITTDKDNLKEGLSKIETISYSTHILKLSIDLGLSHVNNIILKSKKLICFLSNDSNRQKLKDIQKQLNPSIDELLDVIEDIESSCYHDTNCLIALKPYINQLHSDSLDNN